MGTSSVEIRYECTPDDYADGQIAHSKATVIYYAFLGLGALALMIGVTMLPKAGLSVALLEFVFAAAFLLWPLAFLRVWARRDFKKHPHMAGPKVMRVGEQGLTMESAHGTSEVNWSLFTRFRETSRLLLLYCGARSFMIIPKRALASTELNQFRELVHRKISAK